MDNLNSPAASHVSYQYSSYEDADNHYGFTKLEKAALMIAAGMVKEAYTDPPGTAQIEYVAGISVQIAKHVLIEANK